ncbi:MAG: sulfatase-like hydrolase/transferase [Verrucomicrobiales bacterium]
MRTIFLSALIVAAVSSVPLLAQEKSGVRGPNIVFILADDMGIGDVSHTTGRAATPNIDRLAKEGMRFTDAHSSSAVCTPTRYSVLTGRYNWRTRLKKSVFFDPHDRPLIEPGETTVASYLKSNGYRTACVGKWHLGIGWQFLEDFKADPKKKKQQGWDIDYSKPAVTPTSHGFDYFFGIQASLDMAPYVYIENDRATKPGTVTKAFFRPGAAAEDFEAEDCLKDFAEKAVDFIDLNMAIVDSARPAPFFLYLPLTSPHTPIVPSERWQGKSPIGEYGDFLMETDWVVGEILQRLDHYKIADDTLVIFTTDNGCSPAAKIPDLVKNGHMPNGELRGHKADIYEGGHRVPFLVRWPGKVKPGTVTPRLTCQTDFIATCADILGEPLAPAAGVDSVSFLPTLLQAGVVERDAIVHHSIGGAFSTPEGKRKLCLFKRSSGWSNPRPGKAPADAPPVQLFDMEADPAEQNNLALEKPGVVKRLTDLMQKYVDDGRSTPGPPQQNAGKTDIGPRD